MCCKIINRCNIKTKIRINETVDIVLEVKNMEIKEMKSEISIYEEGRKQCFTVCNDLCIKLQEA